MARPTVLTPELHDKIIKALQAGAYMETAAAYAGISKDTFFRWLKAGARYNVAVEQGKPHDESDAPYGAFSDSITKAMADAELTDLILIGKAAKQEKYWTAAAWRLERKYPQRYGANRQPDDASQVEDDPLKKLTDAIAEARKNAPATQPEPAGDVEGGEG